MATVLLTHRFAPPARAARLRSARGALGAALLAPALALIALPGRSQDLVGCQLVGADLQCVPGVSADPQQQIRALDAQISADLQLEGAVQQRINGLRRLVLQGEGRVGNLLTATAVADAEAALPRAAYHWYRLAPGQRSWVLIEGVQGTSYVPAPVDVGQQVMVVAVVEENGQVKRVASQPLGPIQPSP